MVLPIEVNPALVEKVNEDTEKQEPKELEATINFKDVIGLDEVKEILNNNIGLSIKRKDLFDKFGKKRTMGMIMYGPPGNGKTYIIKALKGEYGINVIVASIAEIISSYTGETEKNIRDLFQRAREASPCALFFDEFDSLGMNRDKGQSEGTGQVLQNAVNQLLIEMNGVEARGEDLFVFGATNRPWQIDPALKRGGRFELAIYMPLPKYKDRKAMFRYHLRKPLQDGNCKVNFGRIARSTSGFASADIENICQQAMLSTIKKEHESKQEQKITTYTILKILWNKKTGKSGVEDWFNTFAKEHMKSMNMKDRQMYFDLIADVNKFVKNKGLRTTFRVLSLYVV